MLCWFRRSPPLLLIAAGMMGCADPRLDPYGVGGNGGSDTGSSTSGDGGSTDEDDCPSPNPCILGLAGAFLEDTETGDVIELQVSFTDADGDVDGGMLIYALTEDGTSTQSFETTIDGASAWIVGTNVVTRVGPVKTASSYEIQIVVQDAAGNQSDAGELVVP